MRLLSFSRRDSTCRRRRPCRRRPRRRRCHQNSCCPRVTVRWIRPLTAVPRLHLTFFTVFMLSSSSPSSPSTSHLQHVVPSCDCPLGSSPNDGLTSCVCRCRRRRPCSTRRFATSFLFSTRLDVSSSSSFVVVVFVVVVVTKNTPYRGVTVRWARPLTALFPGTFTVLVSSTLSLSTHVKRPYRGVTVRLGRPLTAVPHVLRLCLVVRYDMAQGSRLAL